MSYPPYIFQMRFRGLCAIVPSKPIDKEPYPQHVDSVTVLIPNLLVSRKLRKRQIMASHYPSIQFNTNQRQGSSDREPDFIVPGKPELGLCFLGGEDLFFTGLGAQTGLDLDNQPSADPTDPTGNESSLFWLAKMEKAKKRAGVLKKGLVRPGEPKREEILGRLVMDRGTFKTSKRTDVATFDDFSTYRQVIAWELLWEVPGLTEAVEIDFQFIDPTQGSSRKKLVLAPHGNDKSVPLTLRNLEIEAFIGKYQDGRGRRGKDFEIHYGLSKASGGRHPVPVLPQDPEPHDSVHELCPPTLFQKVQQ